MKRTEIFSGDDRDGAHTFPRLGDVHGDTPREGPVALSWSVDQKLHMGKWANNDGIGPTG
ncbi:TPA: hypothetical protein ACHFX9_003168 [Citrobacter farmeri]|nr:hypothetical protein [Citrobacter farmeri]